MEYKFKKVGINFERFLGIIALFSYFFVAFLSLGFFVTGWSWAYNLRDHINISEWSLASIILLIFSIIQSMFTLGLIFVFIYSIMYDLGFNKIMPTDQKLTEKYKKWLVIFCKLARTFTFGLRVVTKKHHYKVLFEWDEKSKEEKQAYFDTLTNYEQEFIPFNDNLQSKERTEFNVHNFKNIGISFKILLQFLSINLFVLLFIMAFGFLKFNLSWLFNFIDGVNISEWENLTIFLFVLWIILFYITFGILFITIYSYMYDFGFDKIMRRNKKLTKLYKPLLVFFYILSKIFIIGLKVVTKKFEYKILFEWDKKSKEEKESYRKVMFQKNSI